MAKYLLPYISKFYYLKMSEHNAVIWILLVFKTDFSDNIFWSYHPHACHLPSNLTPHYFSLLRNLRPVFFKKKSHNRTKSRNREKEIERQRESETEPMTSTEKHALTQYPQKHRIGNHNNLANYQKVKQTKTDGAL